MIEEPDLVLSGYRGSLKAVKGYGRNRYLIVVYRELTGDDGFVITAYFASRINRRRMPSSSKSMVSVAFWGLLRLM